MYVRKNKTIYFLKRDNRVEVLKCRGIGGGGKVDGVKK